MIQVENLTRTYDEFTAVDAVNFSIGAGEVVGLLGHNGAGKTTVMKMLTGYLEPTSGVVRIDGLELSTGRRQIQARLGYLPENCPLYPEMRVVEYLEYTASLHGVDNARVGELIRRVIERTGLVDKALQPIATLSRGLRQRVGVAQAILHEPKIIILDEPTNGLDPHQIQHMRTLIRELAATATVIISTHILQEVQAVCDRVIIIDHGRIGLDAALTDLQAEGRLVVSLEQGVDPSFLREIDTVSSLERLSGEEEVVAYALSTDDDISGLAPVVARAVIERGYHLHGLRPEVRSLEQIFSDITMVEGGQQ
ncbi:MAG: multidrug ABC transporter ATP-binding protein [Deltaproteobacteria bacterium]|nr:MAG: multidrug ABC transporter ATP-binding protein [Deltaproteobacteria bacterium]